MAPMPAAAAAAAADADADGECAARLLGGAPLSVEVSFAEDGGAGGAAGAAPPAVARCLYAAHALARAVWRTWEFAVALILMRLAPASLLLVSAYGLLEDVARLGAGPLVGGYVDRTERLPAAVACYGVQNGAIAVSAAAAGLLVRFGASLGAAASGALLWTTVLAGACSSVGSLGAAVAVEREWPAVLCGDDAARLGQVNSVLRAIDLSSQMLAPVAAGFLMTLAGVLPTVAALALACLAAWPLECLLLRTAHARCHRLRQPKAPRPARAAPRPCAALLGCAGWRAYAEQTSTLLAGVALALLYLTVLSLGYLMTGFLTASGVQESTLSLFRAAGAASGLLATLTFRPLVRAVGLVGAGGVGIAWQLACLACGVVPIAASRLAGGGGGQAGGGALLYVLLSGLVASRFGLWTFDLSVLQQQQELVPGEQLGTVSGVQASLQSAFEIASFVAGCVLHRPEQFPVLMAGSVCAVAAAAALYAAHACRGGGRAAPGPAAVVVAHHGGGGGGEAAKQ
ncbi:solute carrier family 40 member 1 [Scenedesmus sp. PABB004]|nr:solute carrier family 40 member 1 [Scenedesmus sp. PABB004]